VIAGVVVVGRDVEGVAGDGEAERPLETLLRDQRGDGAVRVDDADYPVVEVGDVQLVVRSVRDVDRVREARADRSPSALPASP